MQHINRRDALKAAAAAIASCASPASTNQVIVVNCWRTGEQFRQRMAKDVASDKWVTQVWIKGKWRVMPFES